MSGVWTMIIVLFACIFITFLVAWNAAKDKFADNAFEAAQDAFSEGRRSLIVKMSAFELSRLDHMPDVREEFDKRVVQNSPRSETFRPDVEAAVKQSIEIPKHH